MGGAGEAGAVADLEQDSGGGPDPDAGHGGQDLGKRVRIEHLLDQLADACRAPYERALILVAKVELAAASGTQEDSAMRLLAESRVVAARLGAEPLLARITALDDRLGTPHPVAKSHPAGLTEREAEVLGLLACGLSDKEIAAALHLSPRTVGRHVEKAYRKVGARRRAQAAIFAVRHGLLGEGHR